MNTANQNSNSGISTSPNKTTVVLSLIAGMVGAILVNHYTPYLNEDGVRCESELTVNFQRVVKCPITKKQESEEIAKITSRYFSPDKVHEFYKEVGQYINNVEKSTSP